MVLDSVAKKGWLKTNHSYFNVKCLDSIQIKDYAYILLGFRPMVLDSVAKRGWLKPNHSYFNVKYLDSIQIKDYAYILLGFRPMVLDSVATAPPGRYCRRTYLSGHNFFTRCTTVCFIKL